MEKSAFIVSAFANDHFDGGSGKAEGFSYLVFKERLSKKALFGLSLMLIGTLVMTL